MKTLYATLLLSGLLCCSSVMAAKKKTVNNHVNPQGKTVTYNSNNMLFDGKDVLPVMGEIHYARVDRSQWRNELLKMKAGGVNVIASYIFWIHHEEVQGEWDWTGNRDLRSFVELCGELGLKVVLRIGPWCHGECANGGLPDWLVAQMDKIEMRSNDKNYIRYATKYINQVFAQIEGLQWKDGGPIIGMQIENEYGGPWEHLAKLKEIALKAGFDLPLLTRTAWPKLTTPAVYGELVPLYGGYVDGFWDRTIEEMPGEYPGRFYFKPDRNSTEIGSEQLPKELQTTKGELGYPYFTCELGAGMTDSYHRRLYIYPEDIRANAIAKLGSGSNMLGYYMYHGGTNPDSKTGALMSEAQNSPITDWNDLPQKSYDFQTCLGEFGQVNGQYHMLRIIHLFLQDFGGDLALMPTTFPQNNPVEKTDKTSLRWVYRSNNGRGFVFVNTHERLCQLPDQENVQFTLDGVTFPTKPITIPSGRSFFWPYNMPIGAANLVSATVEPICFNETNGATDWYFAAIDGVPVELVMDNNIKIVETSSIANQQNGKIVLSNLVQKDEATLIFTDNAGKRHNIHVLSPKRALQLYKGEVNGKSTVVLSENPVFFDNGKVKTIVSNTIADAAIKQTKTAGPTRVIPIGKQHVSEQPYDPDFVNAAEWQIELPADKAKWNDLMLRIHYVGDVARLYIGDKMVDDNFYNDKTFDFALSHCIDDLKAGTTLKLQILPMPENPNIYLPKEARYGLRQSNAAVLSAEWIETTIK